ncbi:hypothetical protein HII36_48515 [Nonomuraea sp. NN258]|uniref:hypothetical protein n=1 Tax=Nonomuraea antri TaxID=2730852 RepID=UPI0015697FF3|nr:hypothetical protein [Nonomuraea antri]NRQ39624.1 hypothetical protein [Nonomuraea antri]
MTSLSLWLWRLVFWVGCVLLVTGAVLSFAALPDRAPAAFPLTMAGLGLALVGGFVVAIRTGTGEQTAPTDGAVRDERAAVAASDPDDDGSH